MRADESNLRGNSLGRAPRVDAPPHGAATQRGVVHESGKQRAHQKLGLVKNKGDIRENQLTVNTKRNPKGYSQNKFKLLCAA